MPSHQTFHKCSSWSRNELLYLFRAIWSPRWALCSMIDRYIFIWRKHFVVANKCVLVDQSFWNCLTQTPLIVIKVGSCSPIHLVWFMVFNAIFNNISVISWRSILLVEVTRENHWQTLSHNVVSTTPYLTGFELTTFSGDRHWLHR